MTINKNDVIIRYDCVIPEKTNPIDIVAAIETKSANREYPFTGYLRYIGFDYDSDSCVLTLAFYASSLSLLYSYDPEIRAVLEGIVV